MSGPRVQFTTIRPDDVDMRLSICMTVGEWKRVRAAINKSGEHTHCGALGVVCRAIDSVVRQAERVYEPEKSEG